MRAPGLPTSPYLPLVPLRPLKVQATRKGREPLGSLPHPNSPEAFEELGGKQRSRVPALPLDSLLMNLSSHSKINGNHCQKQPGTQPSQSVRPLSHFRCMSESTWKWLGDIKARSVRPLSHSRGLSIKRENNHELNHPNPRDPYRTFVA